MGRLRVTRRYVLRPGSAATPNMCAGARRDQSGLRHALVPRLWPRFAVSQRERNNEAHGQTLAVLNSPACVPACRRHKVLSTRCAQHDVNFHAPPRPPRRHGLRARTALLVPRRPCLPSPSAPEGSPIQAAAPPINSNATPQSASGARDTPALHRMRERVLHHAVKGPLRRCAPLTEQTPVEARPGRQTKNGLPSRACAGQNARLGKFATREGNPSSSTPRKPLIRLGKMPSLTTKGRQAVYLAALIPMLTRTMRRRCTRIHLA